jgi:hypothetical protein
MDALVVTQTPISFIDSATADRLGLKRKKLEPAFGPFTERVEVESLIIGQADFGKTILVVHQSDEDGGIVLGWGFLGRRDVDFDFPNGSLKLFAPDHCRGKVVYWTKDPYAILDYRLTPVGPGLTARLDGEKVQVIVSTGTKTTQIDFKAVKRLFRWRDRPPELSEVSDREGTDSTDPIYRYPFKTLSLGEIEIKAPKINLVDRADPKIVVDQLNLGMSTLGKLHIYFAAKEQKAYLTEGASNSQPPSSPNPGTTP